MNHSLKIDKLRFFSLLPCLHGINCEVKVRSATMTNNILRSFNELQASIDTTWPEHLHDLQFIGLCFQIKTVSAGVHSTQKYHTYLLFIIIMLISAGNIYNWWLQFLYVQSHHLGCDQNNLRVCAPGNINYYGKR